ncbi:MAG: hypothetical protein ABIT08_06860 [Bacteroidia bacterium]
MNKTLLTTKKTTEENDLSTHEKAIVKAFETMDCSALEKLLDEDKEYDEKNKWAFMNGIKNVLEKFRKHGDTRLTAHNGNCNNDDCKVGKNARGYLFEGNNSGKRAAFIFDNKKSFLVENICRCINFNSDDGKECFFLSKEYL